MSVFRTCPFALLFVVLLAPLCAAASPAVAPAADSPQVRYALRRLAAVTDAQTVALRVELTTAPGVGPDGFALRREGPTLVVAGGDARGAMYGVLDVAQQLTQGVAFAAIAPRTEPAALSFRAIKFNLPFAAYRTSPSIELHQETCRDPAYWEAFLDMMAANRFNALTLWSLHPFHYFVVPKSFPEAQTFSDEELAEWRALWTRLFALAKERGIETYLINWNIFVSPEFARAHQLATYSIDWRHFGDGPKDRIVADYTRECVQQVIDEYPDLTGLGITLGERMGGMDPQSRRDWLDASFFAGIDAAHRPVKFIYRAPLSADSKSGGTTSEENDRATRAQIERVAQMPNIVPPVHVEFKFNWSHGHSSPQLFIVHGGKLGDAYWNPAPRGYDVVWTVRNEDIHVLRWGDPQFVRDFVAANHAPHTGGALVGSEVFIPAKDYMSNEGRHRPWRYAFERNWLGWSVWGRLLHTPTTPDAFFSAELGARFGATHGDDLQRSWSLASRTPLRFASFHQGRNDLSLYTEAFSGWRERGGEWRFFDIENFIAHPVLDSRYVNIADFTAAGQKVPEGKISPLALAAMLDRDLAEVARLVTTIRARGTVTPPLDAELTDLECWVEWGGYFAAKLRGGVALAQFRATHQGAVPAACPDAVVELERARDHWKKLATLGTRFNWRQIVFHTAAPFSWEYFLPLIDRDIAIARGEVLPATPRPMGKDG